MPSYKDLYNPLSEFKIKGLGKTTLQKLNKLGINTLYDLFYYFPRTYEDRSNQKKIVEVLPDEFVGLKGVVARTSNNYIKRNRYMFRAWLQDDTGSIELVWFNNRFMTNSLKVGDEILAFGKIKKGAKFQIVNPEYHKINNGINDNKDILPIYSLTSSLKQNTLRKIIYDAIMNYGSLLEENLPITLLEKENLLTRRNALVDIHFPKNQDVKKDAKRRFMYEEIILLEMGIISSRFLIDSINKKHYKVDDNSELVKKYISNLNYNLTNAQKRVIKEIYKDLNDGKIVNRLLQGDVGSGKTVVSMIMLLYMIENDYQGAIMAPTEILATQHYLGIVDEFNKLGVRVELLTGTIKGKKREKLLSEIREGVVDLVIGTHALIEDDIEFYNLGLIIIDEQHRFGVEQRTKLRDKGSVANLLVMSATPIPRSLALTIYGDLDVSIIDEMPEGRTPIKTKWIKNEEEKDKMYDFINKKISEKRQVYVVSPLIEESEVLNVKSATETYEEYTKIFKKANIGLLHGRMKNDEKHLVMEDFKKGKIDILVATTVIEVGVNIINASIMVIRDAQRFGLSSLHQLRGRVGRGEYKSYCFLESETDNDTSKSRLRIMEQTNDGFKIAEEDLKLRNSGEIFGIKQSGVSDLMLTDITKDIKEIKMIREYTIDYLTGTKGVIENQYLKYDVYKKFGLDKLT